MNLHNKLLLITLLTLGSFFSGCDIIYDNLEDCPQGVYVSFYSKTDCDVDSSFIGNTSSITVFAFDENQKLAATVRENDVNLSRDFEVLVPLAEGRYTFIAWAGIDDNFKMESLTKKVSTKDEVLLTLKTASNVANRLDNTRLWQGEQAYPVVIEPVKEYGSVFKHTAVNLRELTNRIKIIVEFETDIKGLTPQDLAVELKSDNSVLRANGTMPRGTSPFTYPVLQTSNAPLSVTWDFATLDLLVGNGYLNNLLINYPEENKTLFDGSLIAGILLKAPNYDLACDNDFTVKFLVKDYCATCHTHFSCVIMINDWIVHSYSTQL